MNIAHSGFIASQGMDGWHETVVDNEVIKFDNPVNGLIVESSNDVLAIKIDNNSENIWYIGSEDKEGIEGLRIKQIEIQNPAGTMLRWKALTY